MASTKEQTVSAKEIITRGFDLPFYKGREIFSYIRQLNKDYPNDPSGILKEIPLNLKNNERYLAAFTLGNQYAPIFKKMEEEEIIEFLATIADEIDIGTDKIDAVLTYILGNVIIKMREQPIRKVIKNIVSTTFSEKEKDYILFSFGMLSR